MNERELKALLDRLDEKTTSVCSLTEAMRTYDQRWDRFHSLILGFGTPRSESTEEFIKRVIAEHKKLAITEREHSALISSLDEVPLEQDDGESYAAYALRVGDAMRALKDDKSTLQKDLHEARLENGHNLSVAKGMQQIVENRDAQIAQLEEAASSLASALTLLGNRYDGELANEFVSRMADEKKRFTLQLDLIAKVIEQLPDSMRMKHGETYETCLRRIQKSHVALDEKCCAQQASLESLKKWESELNALHETIESLPGFPMQPPETYAEYLHRLAADRSHHSDERSKLFADLEHLKASSAQTLERLHAQLDAKNAQMDNMAARNAALADSFTAETHARIMSERDQARRELEEEKTQLQTHKTLLLNAITMRDAALKERDEALLSIEQSTANGRD